MFSEPDVSLTFLCVQFSTGRAEGDSHPPTLRTLAPWELGCWGRSPRTAQRPPKQELNRQSTANEPPTGPLHRTLDLSSLLSLLKMTAHLCQRFFASEVHSIKIQLICYFLTQYQSNVKVRSHFVS